MPAYLVCCPPRAISPTGRTGVRSSGPGDPCRSRTCVRCVRSSRPALGRMGRRCRRWRESGPLERVATTERRAPGSGPGGIGPSREGPATGRAPARVWTESRPHAEPGEVGTSLDQTVARLGGPRRTRTVLVLLAKEVHGQSCVGPMGPLVGDLFSCQGAISARRTRAFGQIGSSHSEAYGGRNSGRPVWSAPSYPIPAAAGGVVFVSLDPGIKKAAPLRKRLERSWTLESPVHSVEHASLSRRSEGMPWPMPASTATRDVMRAACPFIHRWSRLLFASLYRMVTKYMEISVKWKV